MEKPYSIDVVDGITVVRFSKTPTVYETMSAFGDVLARSFTLQRLWIFQFGINFNTDELKKLAQYGKEVGRLPSRTAIVVPDDFSFGLARMHNVFREQEGVELRVFRNEQEAVTWLHGQISY